MPRPFDESESAFTATAGNLVPVANTDTVNFSKWGNPERVKINDCAPMVNLYNAKRYGAW